MKTRRDTGVYSTTWLVYIVYKFIAAAWWQGCDVNMIHMTGWQVGFEHAFVPEGWLAFMVCVDLSTGNVDNGT